MGSDDVTVELDGPEQRRMRERLERALACTEPTFDHFFLQELFGLEISYGDRSCLIEIPDSHYLLNILGTSMNGGFLAMVVDISMGHLCRRFLSPAITLDLHLTYMRPVTGPAVCEARFLSEGRRVVSMRSTVRDGSGEDCLTATGMWYRRSGG